MPKPHRTVNPGALRIAIAKHQIRQFDIAKRAGIPRPTVSQFLNERHGLSLERAERIAEAVRELIDEIQAVRELIAERRKARASA